MINKTAAVMYNRRYLFSQRPVREVWIRADRVEKSRQLLRICPVRILRPVISGGRSRRYIGISTIIK
jgi:hypothetical protein